MLNLPNRIKRIPRVPKVKSTKNLEKEYLDLVDKLILQMQKLFEETVLPYLEQISSSAIAEGLPLRDSWDDQLEQLMTAFNLSLSKSQDLNRTKASLQQIAAQVNNQNSTELQRIVKQMFNVDIRNYEPWLKSTMNSFVKEGVSLITDLSNKTQKDIFTIVQRDIKSGKRVETIKKELLGTNLKPGVFNSVKTRAELIARDQIGKLNGQMTRIRQKDLGIDFYTWRTTGDERVRPAHDALDGRICSWEDDTIYADSIDDAIKGKWKSRSSIGAFIGEPGEDYQCRCYAEPVFETILE